MMKDKIIDSPAKLIDENGAVAFGNFFGPVRELNWMDFDFTGIRGFPWRLGKKLSQKLLKRWQFVGIVDKNFVLGAAIAHVHYLGSGFAYVYDRRSNKLAEFGIKRPFAIDTIFSASPNNGITRMQKGADFIEFDNTPDEEFVCRSRIELSNVLKADLYLSGDATGISTACPQDTHGFHYTYKCAGMKASGSFELNGVRHELSRDAMALFDWTASTPERVTRWNWAAGAGKDAAGRTIGINLSRGLVIDGFSQNSVWVDGQPFILPDAKFEYDPNNMVISGWRVSTSGNELDLSFKAQSERSENINLGLVISRFHQPFGNFSGIIKLPGETIDVNLFGVCEEHLAKW